MVRTRIAPSPTGFAHIGTIYQVLFDYAFAKKNNGQFILRLEDTDQARFVEGAEDVIYSAIDWFGLTEDESPRKQGEYGPYRQSERLDIYRKYVDQLVEKGHAYYCICTRERLDTLRAEQQKKGISPKYDKHCLADQVAIKNQVDNGEPHVIRLNVPEGKDIVCHDEIRGDVVFSTESVDDQVLLKSDGFPTYHLAVVVDDHLMNITHVVRGEEWISSMPKHVLLYEYFGWDMPKFYHTALLRNPDKSKLAKRHGHTSVQFYKDGGYLPEAILNYLGLLGWTHPEGKEIFDLDEFISLFDLKDMKAVGPVFDVQKLEWMNGEYIRAMSAKNLQFLISNFYKNKYPEELIEKIVPLVQERIKTLKEFDDYCEFFIQTPKGYEVDMKEYSNILEKVQSLLVEIPESEWKADVLGEKLQKLAETEGISFSKFFMMLRVALTGKKITPPLNESIEILGKEEVMKRIGLITNNQ